MNTTLLRAGALACALLTTTALTAPALAQTADTPPPTRYGVDENGVDLARAVHMLDVADIAIGPAGRGGLAYVRQLGRGASRNRYDMGVFQAGSAWTATFGLQTYAFSLSGGTYTATDGSGATLTQSGGSYILTAEDGTIVTYGNTTLVTGDSSRKARATNIAYPTGEQVGLAWTSTTYCSNNSDGCGTGVWRTAVRLQSVSSSLGYQLHLNYGLATASDLADYSQWKRLDSIAAINSTVDSCSPSAHSCTLTQSWPTVSYSGDDVTDPMNRTTRYTTTSTTFSIRRPSSSSDNVVYTYDSGGHLTSVVRDGLTWSYNYSVSGTTATLVVTDPGSHSRTIVSDLNIGLPTSVTDEVGKTTTYSYDSAGRLQRITAPEGNYVEYSYNGRGNVTQVLRRDKAGNSANDIVTQADYPTGCSNGVTCNLPTAVRDARGNQTDFTWDSTHGGLPTATAPAPTTGAVRPQTRYTYSSLTAPGGGSVYRVTAVSQCQTGSSCADQADEVRTTIAYSQANLLPSSVSSGSGHGALTATSALGYDSVGRPITVDGPLSGSADTVRTRYNAAGQVIGTISPDPDGAGSLKHRAQRISYNSDGQVNKIETGTVDSQSDSDWANFASLEEVQQEYDTSARPTVQRLVSGSTAYALTQTSYDSEGRVRCVAQRMNPGEFATSSLPSDACTLDSEGSHGPDRITRTTYDDANRPILVQTGYGVTGTAADEVATTYTDNGQVETVTDAEGNRTTYEYDGFDRLRNLRYPSPTTDGVSAPTSGTGNDFEQLGYDADGNVTSRRLRDGATIGYGYDALGRLIAVDTPPSGSGSGSYGEYDRSYVYDNLSRPTQLNSASTLSITLGYDALGRQISETSVFAAKTMQYDLAGRLIRLSWPDGLDIDYQHLVTGEVSAIVEEGTTSLATYGYDDRGRRTSLTRGNGTSTSYSYDNADRLTQLVQNLNGSSYDLTLDFAYNPAGQIVSNDRSNNAYSFTGHANLNRTDTVNGLNQVTATGSTGVSHDARGNISAVGSDWAAYTSENFPSATTSALTLPNPRLRPHQVYNTGTGGAVRFDYLGDTLIAEYNTSNAIVRRYVPGPGTDEPVLWYEGSGTSTRQWFHADERGSVIAVSDSSGNLVGSNPNRYDEYGVAQGTAITGRFGYTAQMWLPELGMYDYRARNYNPSLGRFMQPDPIGYEGGMNLYAYVGDDPVNSIDPSGLADTDIITVVGNRPRPQNPSPTPNVFFTIAMNELMRLTQTLSGSEPDIVVTGRRIHRRGLTLASADLPSGNRFHRYALTFSTLCTASEAFDLLKQPGMSAPGAPAAREGFTPRIVLTGNNPISQYVNSSAMVIVNTTLPGHGFHPGSMRISVTGAGSRSDITFVGTGAGSDAWINDLIGIGYFGMVGFGAQQICNFTALVR